VIITTRILRTYVFFSWIYRQFIHFDVNFRLFSEASTKKTCQAAGLWEGNGFFPNTETYKNYLVANNNSTPPVHMFLFVSTLQTDAFRRRRRAPISEPYPATTNPDSRVWMSLVLLARYVGTIVQFLGGL
jgi:hypothetical protein